MRRRRCAEAGVAASCPAQAFLTAARPSAAFPIDAAVVVAAAVVLVLGLAAASCFDAAILAFEYWLAVAIVAACRNAAFPDVATAAAWRAGSAKRDY